MRQSYRMRSLDLEEIEETPKQKPQAKTLCRCCRLQLLLNLYNLNNRLVRSSAIYRTFRNDRIKS